MDEYIEELKSYHTTLTQYLRTRLREHPTSNASGNIAKMIADLHAVEDHLARMAKARLS